MLALVSGNVASATARGP